MHTILAYVLEPERSAMGFNRLATHFREVHVLEASSLVEAAPALADADILITIGGHMGQDAAALYAAMPKLKWAQSFGTGTDNIKGNPALGADVVVTNVHGLHGPQLSEAAFAAMLSFARHLPAAIHNQDEQRWQKVVPTLLAGKTVGIFGLGAIASALAPRCAAFGMTVVGISGTARAVAGFEMVYARADLLTAVAGLDYLILLTPHTPETHHIIGAAVLAAMKSSAYVINLARGGVVYEAALLAALDAGHIAGAALDVFETEPLPPSHPLWVHQKVIITPHCAGFHADYPEQAYAVVADNLSRYLQGGTAALINKV